MTFSLTLTAMTKNRKPTKYKQKKENKFCWYLSSGCGRFLTSYVIFAHAFVEHKLEARWRRAQASDREEVSTS